MDARKLHSRSPISAALKSVKDGLRDLLLAPEEEDGPAAAEQAPSAARAEHRPTSDPDPNQPFGTKALKRQLEKQREEFKRELAAQRRDTRIQETRVRAELERRFAEEQARAAGETRQLAVALEGSDLRADLLAKSIELDWMLRRHAAAGERSRSFNSKPPPDGMSQSRRSLVRRPLGSPPEGQSDPARSFSRRRPLRAAVARLLL